MTENQDAIEESETKDDTTNDETNKIQTRSMTRVKFADIEREIFEVEVNDESDDKRKDFKEMELKDRKKENYDIYMSKQDEVDERDDLDTFVVELPVSQHSRSDVNEAKAKKISNMEHYEVFVKVKDIGQITVGSRWVVTEKQAHDGQKTKVKARLVTRGFQEENKVQSDSPTANKESVRIFLSIAAAENMESLISIDISAAFLQAESLSLSLSLSVSL